MLPPVYALIYSKLARAAQRHGWCLTLHGSMLRDLDMVLIPWTDDAEHEDKVVDALRKGVEGEYGILQHKRALKKMGASQKDGLAHYAVTAKPHGRRTIAIYLGVSGYYLDISIMPRITEKEQKP